MTDSFILQWPDHLPNFGAVDARSSCEAETLNFFLHKLWLQGKNFVIYEVSSWFGGQVDHYNVSVRKPWLCDLNEIILVHPWSRGYRPHPPIAPLESESPFYHRVVVVYLEGPTDLKQARSQGIRMGGGGVTFCGGLGSSPRNVLT